LGDKIYFRGNNITTSIFSYVFKNFNISSASQVILTGTSAGGMGTFFWGNYLGSILSP
jgi:O-palmitoleoyl-L-serine hydrolase